MMNMMSMLENILLKTGIDYYNLLEDVDEIGIDYQLDTYDGGLHLNFYGAEKLSRYFARILKNNYDLTDFSGDEVYDEKLKNYNEMK